MNSSAGVGIEHCEVIFFPVKKLTTDSKKTTVHCGGIRPNPMEPHAVAMLWSERGTYNILLNSLAGYR